MGLNKDLGIAYLDVLIPSLAACGHTQESFLGRHFLQSLSLLCIPLKLPGVHMGLLSLLGISILEIIKIRTSWDIK